MVSSKAKSGRLKITGRILIVMGIAMIGYYYGTGVYTFFVQRELRNQWQSKVGVKTTGRTQSSAKKQDLPGDVFGRLKIPKLGLDVIVLEGTNRQTLTKGPGHIKGTSFPGRGGNSVISGHRTTFGAPFAKLNDLHIGDRVFIETREGEFAYSVSGSKSVLPTDVSVLGNNSYERLTLTTCDPPGTAVRRLAVWAQRS